ncbi:S-adenosyl-dependent methyltransferase activity on membrane-located substrates [uncultured delta proteobacterium]|uniref:Ribosomal RNA small subunit methyltransferase H n=1 Tax=uncultured delta proteobacterium TaxID=34034 RepID=A0A212JHN9_9DELT|nr:S-adenosyl-dependent methyltransferase activity on membrane-located substrates [uncultured delta proteobacterium]
MAQADFPHVPVLPEEVLRYLAPQNGGRYLDGTVGLGGHTSRILEAAPGCAVLGLDRDESALILAAERLKPFGDRVALRHALFSNAAAMLDAHGWETIDGALVDIGVSSLQLDTPERGFSFLHDGPLDMRMDVTGGDTGHVVAPASKLVNTAPHEVLKEIIGTFGEEPQAGRIARAIIDARSKKPIATTGELAAIVEAAYPAKWRATARNHPATRTFQALRIAVNYEFDELRHFLESIVPYLAPGGRLVVISFHSLEDRIVKHFFRDEAQGCRCPRHIPVCVCNHEATLTILTRKPVTATEEELRANVRASSAKLRAAEKI